jgi:nucleotide-binding universal stress UspA family protein
MTIRDILVPMLPGIAFDAQLDLAGEIARRFDAKVNAVFIRPDAVMAAASVPDMLIAAGVMTEAIDREGKQAGAAALRKFEAWRLAGNLAQTADGSAATVATAQLTERIGEVEAEIVEIGRVSDLIVVNRPDSFETSTERAFSAAVFETGRPTILVPKTVKPGLFDHIVIAWNGSLESARAVDGAMPLLRKAGRVSVFTAAGRDPLRTHGLVDYLARHGIQPEALSVDADGDAVGPALLDISAVNSASMIVLGAYSHSRLREMLLGGVTRHVIRNAAIPVLMMH